MKILINSAKVDINVPDDYIKSKLVLELANKLFEDNIVEFNIDYSTNTQEKIVSSSLNVSDLYLSFTVEKLLSKALTSMDVEIYRGDEKIYKVGFVSRIPQSILMLNVIYFKVVDNIMVISVY